MSINEILPAQRLAGLERNILEALAELISEHKPVNVGHGFPNFSPPEHVKEALKLTVSGPDTVHQYTRSYGHPKLVHHLSCLYSPLFGRDIDGNKEVVVTLGAYTSIFCAIQAFVEPKDEVIIIEPFFSCYATMVQFAGGKPKFIPLRCQKSADAKALSSSDWCIDPIELEGMFNKKTKALILNNPNNPLGKVFTQQELQNIADLCIKHNCLCISDEVYEWIVFDHPHIRMATLPGMWNKTITIGSAGKSFSITGWRTGWSIGPNSLLKHVRTVLQNSTSICPTAVQEALAIIIENETPLLGQNDSYFNILSNELKKKRDRTALILREVGLNPIVPDGGYFMIADISAVDVALSDVGDPDDSWDYKFTKWLIINKKIAVMPTFLFYSNHHKDISKKHIRFCFAKNDQTLNDLADNFKKYGTFVNTA